MKKIIFGAAMIAAFSASAAEFGVTAARDYSGDNRNAYGVTIGQKIGAVGLTAGFDRATKGGDDQNRYSVVVGYDVAKIGSVTLTPKVGAAFLDNQTTSNGYAMTVGVGASVPVTKQVSFGVDLTRQYGQDRVDQFDGNRLTTAIRYSF